MKKIKIELTPAEAKLLVHYLHAHAELRMDDSCNDLCKDEIEDIGLTEEEWKPLLKEIGEDSPDNGSKPYKKITRMSAPEPIYFLYNKIQQMLPEEMQGE